MKNIFIVILFVVLSHHLFSQQPAWSWAVMGSGTYGQEPTAVAVDAQGNVYMTGRFGSPTLTLPPMNIPNSGATGTDDYFLAKYDAAGMIQWVHTIGGPGNEQGMAVSVDAAGNVYATGRYTSPSILSGSLTNNSNSGLADIFMLKYNSSGNVLWASSYGGTSDEYPAAIMTDASGNIYLGGNFYSLSVNFGSYGVIHSGNGDAFVARFNTNGVPQWAMQIGGSGNDKINCGAIDASGNAVVAGEFNSSALGYSPNLVNQGGVDMFIATYDASGGIVMSTSFGSANDEGIYALATDMSSNIYVTGYYQSPTLAFGSHTISNQSSSQDIFLTKLNSSGSVQWALRNDADLFSTPKAVTTDLTGHVFLAGYFHIASMTFGSTTLTNVGGLDGYLASYDAITGNVNWAKGIHDNGNEQPVALDTDVYGDVYMAGIFGYTLALGSTTLIGSMQASGEIFLGKLCLVPPTPTVVPGVTVCPHSIAQLSVSVPGGFKLNWYNALKDSLLYSGNTFSTAISCTVLAGLVDTLYGCGVSSVKIPVTFSIHPSALISIFGNTLIPSYGTIGGVSWQWFDCNYGGLISEYNDKPLVPYQSGSYALITHIGSCTDTTSCMTFIQNGIGSQSANKTMIFGGDKCIQIIGAAGSQCHVTDLLGRTISKRKLNDQTMSIIPDLMPGIYLVNIENRDAMKVVVW